MILFLLAGGAMGVPFAVMGRAAGLLSQVMKAAGMVQPAGVAGGAPEQINQISGADRGG